MECIVANAPPKKSKEQLRREQQEEEERKRKEEELNKVMSEQQKMAIAAAERGKRTAALLPAVLDKAFFETLSSDAATSGNIEVMQMILLVYVLYQITY